MGLQVIGVIVILLEARKRRVISSVQPHIKSLRQVAGFYISDSLNRKILEIEKEL